MNRRFHTYTAYSIGAALVWAVILITVTATGSSCTSAGNDRRRRHPRSVHPG